MTVRGHAAVFNRWSLDLGGFREKIAPDAFTEVLDTNPDVHAVWDHDTKYVLARTKNKTLELRVDPMGLHFWARVAPTSYAADLRVLMERGDVDQASFAFTVPPGGDEWKIKTDDDGNEIVQRTIRKVSALYDVTVTAQGAYPQTGTEVVRSLRSKVAAEIERGHLPQQALAAMPDEPEPEPKLWVPATATTENLAASSTGESSSRQGEDEEQGQAAPSEEDLEARKQALESLRNYTAAKAQAERERVKDISQRKYQLGRDEK